MSELESIQTPPPSAPVPSSEDRARNREALIGKSIAGRYVLRSLLGHGGMGAVYEAENVGIGKRVAIKFVDQEFISDEQVLTRFAREARAMSSIESAHIVTIFDAGTEDGRPYLVMELLRGEDLGQLLRRETRVPLPQALHIIAMVLKGLSKAHAAGIVHRDLKPDNIFLVKNDDGAVHAKIVDFGVSKIERPRNRTSPLALTGRGTILGTPFYMSPEQAQAMNDVDGRADLFSVGTILFECLAGRPPHTGETYEQIILSICMRDAPPLGSVIPDIPAPVSAFVARALSRDRAQRFSSADEMLAALHELSPDEKKLVPREPSLTKNGTLVVGAAISAVPASVNVQNAARPFHGNATQIAGSGQGDVTGASTPVSVPAHSVPSSGPRSDPRSGPRSVPVSGPSQPLTASSTDLTPAGLPRSRSMGTVIVAAVVATLLGVVATFAIVSAVAKKPPPAPAPAASVAPSAVATPVAAVPVSALPAAAASAAPAVSESATPKPPAAPVAAPAPPPIAAPRVANSGGKPPAPVTAPKPPAAPGKSLDIARDLP